MWISQRARSRPSITAEQLRIITLRMALKRAAVVCVFFPLLLPFHPLPLRLSRFSSGLKRWHFARRRERRRGDVEEEKDGGRLRREQGVVWLFEHFRHKFAREGTRGSFAAAQCTDPSTFPILVLSSPLLSLSSSRWLFVLMVACRAFRPIRGSLARLECPWSLLPVFENATEQ